VTPTTRRGGLSRPTLIPRRPVRLLNLDPDDVAAWLEQVIPHLGDDDTLPFLAVVHILLAGGRVHAYATDRYTGAIATLPFVATDQHARFTVPGAFATRAIGWLRGEEFDPDEDGAPSGSVDLTVTERSFELTLHLRRDVYFKNDAGGYDHGHEDTTTRLAVEIDPDAETLNFPRVAAEILAAEPVTGPVHLNPALLARFLGWGPVLPFDPATGHLLEHGGDLLAGYAVHTTASALALTRPNFLGILCTCRLQADRAGARATSEAATRETWQATLATIA
jgi:hypothetical protein